MKIINLVAENFKKLTAVEITPDGNMVIISGKNAAGKSSVLDAIEATLRGGRCLPKDPIKTGEIRGKTEVLLGDTAPEYKVTRKFFGSNSTLVVETVGGTKAKIASPQAFLDKIVGDLSFDPLVFLKKQPAEQRNTLIDFLGLNLEDFANKIEAIKTERSSVRREKERRIHEAESLVFTPNLPPQEVSSEQLLGELGAANTHNQSCQEAETEIAITRTKLLTVRNSIEAAQAAIESWQKNLSKAQQLKTQLKAKLNQPPPLKCNTADVEEKLKSLSATNEAIRTNIQKREAEADFEACIKDYYNLGEDMKVIENQKAKKLAETVMPIIGLTILSDGLAYEGIPLEQINDAKKLEICVCIAMAMNPKLKVLRIKGNDLDAESLRAIGRIVEDQDYQIWVEKVSDNEKIGFYIEDGNLVVENK